MPSTPPTSRGGLLPAKLIPALLRCECRVTPLGVGATRPRLSWVVQSPARARMQRAYRVLVASSEEKLKAGEGDLWDSGKVLSGETAHIVYGGKRLTSGARCHWKVRVWDNADVPSPWSAGSLWTMGLLKASDWRAEWIGYDRPRKEARRGRYRWGTLLLPPARYLRREFRLRGPVRRATLYATALGIYGVFLNGRQANGDYLSPGWTDYDKRVYCRTYDVTELLRQGGNAIGAILADGWYAGYYGWAHRRDYYGRNPRLLAQLQVEYLDGARETIVTDRSWRASTGPITEADLLMGESYDARREMPGWAEAGFDNRAWARCSAARRVKTRVEAAPHEPIRAIAEIKPVKVTQPARGVYIFDMGQNFAGVTRLRVCEPRGRKIVLRHAERLNPDGTLYVENIRKARATDTYICRGGGMETWQPSFTCHGFQYVEVRGLSRAPARDTLTGVPLSSDTPAAGDFRCSDRMVNRLFSNIVWTQRANFLDIPTDCPQRDERLGWTGDAQIFIRTASYNADVAAFFAKWLTDVFDAQHPDGAISHVAPSRTLPKRLCKAWGQGGAAAWADAAVICPWTLYEVYGDKRILNRHYESMARWISYCRRNSRQYLRPANGFGDWLSIPRHSTPKDVLGTAYFARSAQLMARVAEALGKRADAAMYGRLFAQIRDAFNRAYVAADGRIVGDTQAVYVLALAFDLLPGEKRPVAMGHLLSRIAERNGHLSTGFIGTKDLMATLTNMGRTDVAYRLLHNKTYPSWGFSIRHGATSLWERWNGWTPEDGFADPGMNSFAHYAFGAVGEWMFRTVAGIDTDGPGFKRLLIRPVPGGKLTSVRAEYRSIRGPVKVEWRLSGDELELDVGIPANTAATVYIPGADSRHVTESGKAAHKAEGVRFIRNDRDAAVYETGSGSYRFRARNVRPTA